MAQALREAGMSPAATKSFLQRLDGLTVLLYFLLVAIGLVSVFSVEYQTGQPVINFSNSHTRQAFFFGLSLLVGIIILFTDSKAFAAGAFLAYLLGIVLLLLTLAVGKNLKGSHSWLGVGSFMFQPGEVCKIFTALALAKFLSLPETAFKTWRHRGIGIGIVMLPCAIIILQNETGLALVYLSFFLAMYREGLPGALLITGFSLVALGIASLLLPAQILGIALTVLAIAIGLIYRRKFSRSGVFKIALLLSWSLAMVFTQFVVPFTFKKVLQGYQIERIYSMLGTEVPEAYINADGAPEGGKKKDYEYNVNQSKIAIGSGGLIGKGLLNGTSTRGDFVPEQNTDFIFCSVGEQFGFIGSSLLILLYVSLMLRIVHLAERQRSVFSRVYAYCVASILFFHFAINISMTIGLAPVIGITLPFLSYGGSSLVSFSILIFILLRLDADRHVLIR